MTLKALTKPIKTRTLLWSALKSVTGLRNQESWRRGGLWNKSTRSRISAEGGSKAVPMNGVLAVNQRDTENLVSIGRASKTLPPPIKNSFSPRKALKLNSYSWLACIRRVGQKSRLSPLREIPKVAINQAICSNGRCTHVGGWENVV